MLIPYPDAFYRHAIAAGPYPYILHCVYPLKLKDFIKRGIFSRPSDYGVDPIYLRVSPTPNGTYTQWKMSGHFLFVSLVVLAAFDVLCDTN